MMLDVSVDLVEHFILVSSFIHAVVDVILLDFLACIKVSEGSISGDLEFQIVFNPTLLVALFHFSKESLHLLHLVSIVLLILLVFQVSLSLLLYARQQLLILFLDCSLGKERGSG